MLSHHSRTPIGITLRTTTRSRRQGGYVLVMFALLLVPLLLMVGFAVDVGYWYNRASDIRRAADAAALAGVVWLPDVDAARTAALAAAAQNGFVPGGNISIDIEPSEQSERRLKVTIRDSAVGSFFYRSIVGKTVGIERTSYAEYVLAVPMGSPRNFFGTGTLLADYTATGIPAEYLYQSVNPYCTDKVNGDRFQSGYDGGTCSGTANSEYRDSGYQMYIEAPEGRTSPIEVRLYDARYNPADISWTEESGQSCTTRTAYTPADPDWTGPAVSSSTINLTGPAQYQTRSTVTGSWGSTVTLAPGQTFSRAGNLLRYRQGTTTWNPLSPNWTGPTTSTSNVTINGLAEYQTRASSSGSWSSTQTLAYGSSVTRQKNLIRYRLAVAATEQYCVPSYSTVTDSAVDDKRQSGDETYTYTLYAADNTPLNDEDNPQICQKSFTLNTAFDDYEYLGSRRWNTLCTIATDATSGRYILRVTNGGVRTNPEADGSNQWGLVAKYTGAADGLCDGRTDSLCPRVYGRDAISVRAAATTQVASFYLAEIDRQHTGKKLKLELYDPGEGGQKIEIMRPTGTDGNTWSPTTFSWKAANVSSPTSGTNVTSLDVTNSKFNGKLVEITIDLTGYDPPLNNQWWQIRYTFSGTVTDRTTWSARIIGDPVHLVEEH
jgi:hypothetical protein